MLRSKKKNHNQSYLQKEAQQIKQVKQEIKSYQAKSTPRNFISKFLFLVLGAMEMDEKVKLPTYVVGSAEVQSSLPATCHTWVFTLTLKSKRHRPPSPPCHLISVLSDKGEPQPIPVNQLQPWKSWDLEISGTVA